MTETVKQLMALRAITETTGALHEAQVVLLRNWGAVAFQPYGKGAWEAVPDTDTKTITYTIKAKNHVGASTMVPYVMALDRSVKWLLGDEWAVNIMQNGRALYLGTRTKRNVNEHRKVRAADRAGSRRP